MPPPPPPRVEVFLPVGVDCLVKPGFCRLWSFLSLNPALYSPFTSVMSPVTDTLSLQNHCSCIPVPPPTLYWPSPSLEPKRERL